LATSCSSTVLSPSKVDEDVGVGAQRGEAVLDEVALAAAALAESCTAFDHVPGRDRLEAGGQRLDLALLGPPGSSSTRTYAA
jgi:hypothetical protein